MDPTLATLSLMLLTYGQNTLPPRHVRPEAKCPAAKPQNNFDLADITGHSYYFNYGFANKDALDRFLCVKLRIEKKDDGFYLHISGVKANNHREQAWHKLKRNDTKLPGHYEIDFRTNSSKNEADAFIYYDKINPESRLYVIICTKFPVLKKHATGAFIASSAQILNPKKITNEIRALQRNSHVRIGGHGFVAKNNCKLPFDPLMNLSDVPDLPHHHRPHSHHHHHPHHRPQSHHHHHHHHQTEESDPALQGDFPFY